MSADIYSMVKITFMAPRDLVDAARKYARENDRDLSSVCRLGLRELLKVGGAVTVTRGRPRTKPKPRIQVIG